MSCSVMETPMFKSRSLRDTWNCAIKTPTSPSCHTPMSRTLEKSPAPSPACCTLMARTKEKRPAPSPTCCTLMARTKEQSPVLPHPDGTDRGNKPGTITILPHLDGTEKGERRKEEATATSPVSELMGAVLVGLKPDMVAR